jgi:hypothetical protein
MKGPLRPILLIIFGLSSGSLYAQFGGLHGIQKPDEVRKNWATEARPSAIQVQPEMSLTAGARVFPEFANGAVPGFPYSARTTVDVVNMTGSPVSVLVEFFDKSGQPLSVALEDPNNLGTSVGHFPGVTGTVQPFAGAGMRTFSTGEPFSEGWARVTTNPPNSLAPTSTIALISPGLPQFEVAIPLSDRFENNIFLPFLNTDIYSTVVGATNDTATSETVTVIARNGVDGSEMCRVSLPVGPQQSGGGALTDLLPCTAGTNGSIQIQASGQGLATMAMWVTNQGTITPIAPIQRQ